MSANPVLLALYELLERHPGFDLVSIDWQVDEGPPLRHAGPWVLVELGQRSESWDETPAWAVHRYAIWKRTGAVHGFPGGDGAVTDDPLWTPTATPN